MIDFATISRDSFVGRVLRFLSDALPSNIVLPILQGDLAGRFWMPRSSVPGCWLGYYEHGKQRLFARSIRRGDVVFDVGANVGFYTLLAATRCGKQGTVIAFEPLPRNVHFLRRHVRLNRLTNTRVIEAAVADFSGEAQFAGEDNFSEGRLSSGGDYKVRVVALDELYASGAVPRPSVIKIDVEGAELAVLHGARALLTEAKPTVYLATHGTEVHRSCCEFLAGLGYTVQALEAGDAPVETTDELLAFCS